MAVDKLVDSAVLDAALGAIADVIRNKTGISGTFDFPSPNDLADEIDFYLLMPTGTKSITENGTGIDVANYSKVDVSVSGGGSSVASGTFTPGANTLTKTIDVGSETITKLLLYATSTPFGNSARCGALIYVDLTANANIAFGIFSNTTGSSPTGKCYFSSMFMGVTKSGSEITITSSGGSAEQFNNFISGVTYQWYAW